MSTTPTKQRLAARGGSPRSKMAASVVNGSPRLLRNGTGSPKTSNRMADGEDQGNLSPSKRRRRELDDSVESLASMSSSSESLQRFIDKSLEYNMASPENARWGEFEQMVASIRTPSEVCPTPSSEAGYHGGFTGTPGSLGDSFLDSPFTTQRKYGLMGSIENSYNFLMSDEVVEMCKSTESDLSLSDEGDDNKAVTFTEFLQLYTELNEWISQSQAAVRRRSNGNVEKHLCQGFYHKLSAYKPKLKRFLAQGRGLTRRYPAMKEENGERMDRIQGMWRLLEEAVGPLRPELQLGVKQDVCQDLYGIEGWCQTMKGRLNEVELGINWTEEERQLKLAKNKLFLEEIATNNLTLTSVKRLLEDEEAWSDSDLDTKAELEVLTSGAEQDLHVIWLHCLGCNVQLEDQKKKLPRHYVDESFESSSTQTDSLQATQYIEGVAADLSGGFELEDESDYDTIPFASHEYEKIHEEEMKSLDGKDSSLMKQTPKSADVGYSSGSASHEENEEGKVRKGKGAKLTPQWRHSLTSAYDTSSNNGSENNLHLQTTNHSTGAEPEAANHINGGDQAGVLVDVDQSHSGSTVKSVRKRLAFTSEGQEALSTGEFEALSEAGRKVMENTEYRHATDSKHSVAMLVKQAESLVRETQLNQLSELKKYSYREETKDRSLSEGENSGPSDSSDLPPGLPRRPSPRPISQEGLFELAPTALDHDQSISESALHRIKPGSPISSRKLQHKAPSDASGLGRGCGDSTRQRRRRRLGHSRSTDVGSRGHGSESEEEHGPEEKDAKNSSSDDVHNKSADFSDHAWDTYQAAAYSNLSDGLSEEERLDDSHFQADWDDDVPVTSIANYALRSKPAPQSRKNRREASPSFPDSDSDLEDFHHVLTESQRALAFTEDTLLKRHNDPMQTGINLDPTDYNESLATCRTQVQCLEEIVNTLRSEVKPNEVIHSSVNEVQELICHWRELESVAFTRLRQSQDLADLYKGMMNLQKQLEYMEHVMERQDFRHVQELEDTIKEAQHFGHDLSGVEDALKVKDNDLLKLLNNSDDLDLLQYTRGLERLHDYLAAMHQFVPERLLGFHKGLLAWHKLIHKKDIAQQLLAEADVARSKPQECLEKLEEMKELLSNREQQLSEVATCCHGDQVAELRKILDELADEHKKFLTKRSAPEAGVNPAVSRRATPSLLARILRSSLPLSLLALLILGLLYMLKPDLFDGLPLTLTPELRYVNGAPPT